MKALGVTLALSCAVALIPATAHAERIGANAGTKACSLDSDASRDAGEDFGNARRTAALSEDKDNDNDVTFSKRSGLEHSANFANHGSSESFADDRSSFSDQVRSGGFGEDRDKHLTTALWKRENHGHGENRAHGEDREEHGGNPIRGSKPLIPKADAAASPNPEPASMLLIGTGLAGLFRYRRQLFV
jgi:hypothetical protein